MFKFWGQKIPGWALIPKSNLYLEELEIDNNFLIENGYYTNPYKSKIETKFLAKYKLLPDNKAYDGTSSNKNNGGLCVDMLSNEFFRNFVTNTIIKKFDRNSFLNSLTYSQIENLEKFEQVAIALPRYPEANKELQELGLPIIYPLGEVVSTLNTKMQIAKKIGIKYTLFTGANDKTLEILYHKFLKGDLEKWWESASPTNTADLGFSVYSNNGVAYMNCLNLIRSMQTIKTATNIWTLHSVSNIQKYYWELLPEIFKKVRYFVFTTQGNLTKEDLKWMLYNLEKLKGTIKKYKPVCLQVGTKKGLKEFLLSFGFSKVIIITNDPAQKGYKGSDLNGNRTSKTIIKNYKDNLLEFSGLK